MNKLESILSKFPQYYQAKEDSNSTMYNVVKAFGDELEYVAEYINRADNMVGIETTADADLEFRWGSLLNIPKLPSETYAQYRMRLKNSISMMSGGTAQAIKYAIAITLGINNDPVKMDKMIHIYDAWEYDGELDIPDEYKTPAHIICELDLMGTYYSSEDEQLTIQAIIESKAGGIQYHLYALNFVIKYYIDLAPLKYAVLGGIQYDKLGREV